ncbi:LysR family transcriptional regulator [Rhodobacteraceae bacterium 2376]|uniref:LysR family transcriptional regulator n=1 Tax=Rhabdonatronobacter sediminivivens TaxID=2743469 RepID=A0A7Z0KXQ4_9RHOB|nr:LysR family transcriptional regulator [Rhabdonatronobacter sediminivivens]NYS24619.1 LysR family transcriptional regulator [Rhabdonatronobacter sediminivivens]
MAFENWDELRTAYHVARAGTVSGAAEALGVHHATVIRHVDALEQRLGVKLFQRHARGYTPTEAGTMLMKVGQTTDEQFAQLAARLTGGGDAMTGDLTVTSLPLLAPMLMPALAALRRAHPGLRLHYLTDTRVLRLEYGEAHVAIRAGARPQEPDNVVQPLCTRQVALYGAPAYLDRHGRPETEAQLAAHAFVRTEMRAPFSVWLSGVVPDSTTAITVTAPEDKLAALRAGLGLGFVFADEAPPDLEQVLPPRPDWAVPLWLVTHMDLHRTPKVQATIKAIKAVLR